MSESSNEITIAQPIVATAVETRRFRSLRRPAWVLSVIVEWREEAHRHREEWRETSVWRHLVWIALLALMGYGVTLMNTCDGRLR